MSEYHVLIVWNKAQLEEESVVNALSTNLSIEIRFLYSWDENYAKENYAAFYGEKLEDITYKVDHCGKGPFRVYLICDSNPKYEERMTSSGSRVVNTNLFDLKAKLRNMTGGGHLVHASDTELEANLNCMSLFGLLADETIKYYSSPNNEYVNKIERNITGAVGWESWKDLLKAIDKITPYVVLRNVETILSDKHSIHGDTDLLVGDFQTAITLAAAQKEAIGKDRVLYSVFIAGSKQLIDFRHIGDDYYCKEWESNMLSRRVKYKDTSFYVLNDEDYSYSLLYHALVHKPYITNDYKSTIRELFGTVDADELKKKLTCYLKKNNYKYSKPIDSSVFIHPCFSSYISLPISRRFINQLKVIKYKRGGYDRENVRDPKISKMLYRGYYMGLTILRKTKARIKKAFNR